MIFKSRYFENPYSKITELIRKDLVQTLTQKGIQMENLKIEINRGKVNISMHINAKNEDMYIEPRRTRLENISSYKDTRNLLFR